MNGILCKPETLEQALRSEWMLADVTQSFDIVNGNAYEIFNSLDASDLEKLDALKDERVISDRSYRLLRRDISTEKTIPKKIVDYFGGILNKWAMGKYVT